MPSCRLSFLTHFTYPIAALLVGCGSIDLKTTILVDREPTVDNSGDAVRSETFYVSGRKLFDPCGMPVVLRGVNEMVTYIPGYDALPAFTEIAKTGANSVRIYWHTSDSSRDLDRVLGDTESQKLIAIVYVFNDESREDSRIMPTNVAQVVDYWTRSDVARVIKRHEHWTILALREKSDSPNGSSYDWTSNYDDAVTRLRHESINVPLAIDAPNAGSDVETLLALGQERIAADPLHNLLLNVNAGVSSDSAETLAVQLQAAYTAELPLLVGEISGYSHNANYNCGDAYAFSTVLAAAEQTQTGWLAWSWGFAQNWYCSQLDMTIDGTFDGLGDWGLSAAVTDPNSIQHTAHAAHYVPGTTCP